MTIDKVLDIFYPSDLYQLINYGISDMHCRSDLYLVEELEKESKQEFKNY